MKTLFLPLFLFLCNFQSSNFETYCNSRFSFCIEYPAGFIKQLESDNEDGIILLSKDKKTEIRAFGSLAIEGFDKINNELETASSALKTITYKVVKKDWFIISGTDAQGRIVYRKTVKRKITHYGDKDTDVFQTLMISYPTGQKSQYDSYCQKIAKSL